MLVALALGAVALGAGRAAAQVDINGPDLPDTPIATQSDADTDAAIAERIRAILSEIDGYGGVEVAVAAGVVTMTGQAIDEAAAARLTQIVRRVDGVVAVNDRVLATTNLAERLAPIRDRLVFRAWQTVAYLPLLLVALVAFLLIYLLGAAIARAMRLWRSLAPNAFIAAIYAQVVRLVFSLAGLVVALDILGATALLGSILGAAGIIGLAIGFAVRDTVENFIASVMLSIRQPFAPFDLIEVEGDVGKVVRLTSRATILLSPNGNFIRVPNATVFKARLKNFTRNPERRFTIGFDVDGAADIAELRDALQHRLAALPFVLAEPATMAWVEEDRGSAVRLAFAGWIDQRDTNLDHARGEAIRVLRADLARRGAAAPPPLQRIVTLDPEGIRQARQAPAANAELEPSALADLANTEERDLERMVQAEREVPETRDLLAGGAPKE